LRVWQLIDPKKARAVVSLGWRPPRSDPLKLAGPGDPSPSFHRAADAAVRWIPAMFSEVHTFYDVWQVAPDDITMRSSRLDPNESLKRS
jgi:hypothetical protein